jgi:hypothetical protein
VIAQVPYQQLGLLGHTPQIHGQLFTGLEYVPVSYPAGMVQDASLGATGQAGAAPPLPYGSKPEVKVVHASIFIEQTLECTHSVTGPIMTISFAKTMNNVSTWFELLLYLTVCNAFSRGFFFF